MDKQIMAYQAKDTHLQARFEALNQEYTSKRSQAAIQMRKLEGVVINERDRAERGVKERDLVSAKFLTVSGEREALKRELELLQRQCTSL
jgi:hypothetical protein